MANRLAIGLWIFLLICGYRGYLGSWDFWTLWGIHVKTEWALEQWWISAWDLPARIPYQSFLGSVIGKVNQALSPNVFWDKAWVLFLLTSSSLLLVNLARRVGHHLAGLALVIALLMISPSQWGSLSWGGYVDLSVALSFCLGYLSYRSQKWTPSCLYFLLCVLIKPVSWVLLTVFLMSQVLSSIRQSKFVWVLAPAFLLVLLNIATYQSLWPATHTGHSLYFNRIDKLFINLGSNLVGSWVFFAQYNFAMLGLVALFIANRKHYHRQDFAFLLLFYAYLVVLYSTTLAGEKRSLLSFPSLPRYLLPVYLLLCCHLIPRIGTFSGWARKLGWIVLVVVIVVRAAEDVPRLNRSPRVLPTVAESARAEVLSFFSRQRPIIDQSCKGFVFLASSFLNRHQLTETTPLRLAYDVLPIRLRWTAEEAPVSGCVLE
jgi:hypothetical protein